MDDMTQIQGERMKKNTGQKIRVRNSIIDGDQMIIITNMGQISMEGFSRNYIQASDEVYDDEGNVIATEKMTSQPSEQSNIKIETINDQEYFIDDKPVSFNNLIEKPIVQQNINNIDLIKKYPIFWVTYFVDEAFSSFSSFNFLFNSATIFSKYSIGFSYCFLRSFK